MLIFNNIYLFFEIPRDRVPRSLTRALDMGFEVANSNSNSDSNSHSGTSKPNSATRSGPAIKPRDRNSIPTWHSNPR